MEKPTIWDQLLQNPTIYTNIKDKQQQTLSSMTTISNITIVTQLKNEDRKLN